MRLFSIKSPIERHDDLPLQELLDVTDFNDEEVERIALMKEGDEIKLDNDKIIITVRNSRFPANEDPIMVAATLGSASTLSELEKWSLASGKNEVVEFMQWANEKHGMEFGKWDGDRFYPANVNVGDLLYDFYDVDAALLEEERRAMLENLR